MARARINRLAALQAITAELVAVSTPADAGHAVLTRGLHAVGADDAGIRLLSEDGRTLVLLDREGYSGPMLATAALRLPVTLDAPSCWAVREGRPIFLPDQAACDAAFPAFAAVHARNGFAAMAAHPLLVDGRILGCLILSYRDPQRFDRRQRTFVHTLADLTAQALDRTRLYVDEHARANAAEELARLRHEQAAMMHAIAEVGLALNAALEPARLYEVILEQAARVLPADHATITLYALETATFAASLGTPRVEPGTIVAIDSLWLPTPAAAPVYLADADAVPHWHRIPPLLGEYRERSIISVPLILEGALVGSFDVSCRVPRHYSAQHVRLAAEFGVQATQALRNARLYEAERERARIAEELAAVRQEQAVEAAALDKIGAVLHGSLDLTALYTCILEQAARVLPCDFAVVVRYADGWTTVEASLGEPRPTPGTRLFPSTADTRMWFPDSATPSSYLPDTALEPCWQDVPPWIGSDRQRSVISVPLRVDGVLHSAFSVASRIPHAYGERHQRLAGLFAERALQALRNARLYAAERERADAAEMVARMRSEFVTTVSHELRTPLTAVLGYAEVLEDRWSQLADARRLEYVRRIASAANRQQRLVDDLLLLGRLDGQVPATHSAPVVLAPLIESAAEEVRASYAGQEIALSGPVDLPVLADAERVVQVIANLIDNAAKYSPEGSPVAVAWGVEEGGAVVRVRDHGTGVPAAGMSRLFTRFGRVPGSPIRAGHVGTGLGLYLSRQLAQAMGGQLALEETGPTGSTFVLRLQLAETPPRG